MGKTDIKFDPSVLPKDIQGQERAEMIEDANEFLEDAQRRERPNLHTYLGREKWQFMISFYMPERQYTLKRIDRSRLAENERR